MANSPCTGERRVVSRVARSTALLAGMTVCIAWPAFADNTDITNKPAVTDKADKSHGADSWGHFLDVANPYASVEIANDSNIYRLDDIQTVNEIIPTVPGRSDDRGDQYAVLAAGFDAAIRSGQQQYGLLGEINTTRYDHHSEIDYDGGKAAAVWHWTANELLTGTAGYRFSRTLRNFANQLAPRRDIDVRTENRVFASADRDLPDNWKLGVRGDYADVAFSTTTSLDLHRATGGASVSYVSHAGNTLGFDVNYINADYQNNSKQNYSTYTVGPTLEWKFTVRTQLTATLGYTARNNSSSSRPDYSAATGRAALTIADAGRGSLTASVWRELSNFGDEIAEYTIVDGASIEPAWTLSNGLTVRLKGAYEHRDFKVVTGVEPDRLDDVGTVSGFLDWPIGRHFKITAGVTTERRSSTRLDQDYEFLEQQLQIIGTL